MDAQSKGKGKERSLDDAEEGGQVAVVSMLGPLGTYTHQAARRFMDGSKTRYEMEERITDVFEAVDSGRSRYGVVPVENSTNGLVKETQECLSRYSTHNLEQTTLRIGHAVLRQPGASGDPVERVYSHEQALGQCRRYIAQRYPHAEVIPVNSTAFAAQMAKNDRGCVAISSLLCAEVYGLEVIDTEVQDGQVNETTFRLFTKSGLE